MPSNESRISNESAFWAFVIIAMNFHRIIYPALITLTYWLKRDNPIEACRQKSRLTIYMYLQGTLTNCIFMEKISSWKRFLFIPFCFDTVSLVVKQKLQITAGYM